MMPKIFCPECGHPIDQSDKFCSGCGIPIDWQHQPQPPPSPPEPGKPGNPLVCSSCGFANPPGAETCSSCGTALTAGRRPKPAPASPRNRRPPAGSAIAFFQSWKFTTVAAALLIGAVIFFSTSHKGNNPHEGASLSPGEENAIQEIESLQKHVDATPGDTASILRLANLLQDVRFYTRAITTYQRYLALVPSNPDAWVDMGTTFFALSFEDSTRRDEYIASARQGIEKALAIAPQHQLAYFNLGIIDLHSGNAEKAADDFQRCIALDPNSEAGKKASQFLSQHPLTNPTP